MRSQRARNREKATQLVRLQRLQARDNHYLQVRKRVLEGLGVPDDLPNDEAERLVKALERRY